MQIQKLKKTKLEFPEEWIVSTINELREKQFIYEIQDGNHGELYPRKKDFSDHGRIFLTANSITDNGQVNVEKSLKLPEEYCKKLRIGFAKPGDILFTHNATVGRVAILPEEFGDCVLGTSVTYYRLNTNKISRQYFAFSLQSPFFKNQLNQIMFQTTRAQVPITAQARLSVIIPTLREQQKIATILSKVDVLIRKTGQIIEQTERLKKGLMQRLLTKGIGHTRFKKLRFYGNFLEIPEEWKIGKLGDYAIKIGSGITPRGGSKVYQKKGIPLIRSQNVHFDGLKLDDVAYITEEIDEEMKNSRTQIHDVLLNITGASVGRCTYVPSSIKRGNVNQHVCIIRLIKDINTKYLCSYLSSNIGQSIIHRSYHGLSREGLTFSQIRTFLILIPPLEEQNMIGSFLTTINSQSLQKTELKLLLEKLKKGLMQQLLTGKIRVKV